jgi:hypothetical protein
MEFLTSNDPAVRQSAAQKMYVFSKARPIWYEIAGAVLKNQNPAVRISFLNYQSHYAGSPYQDASKPYVEALVKLLDDPDVAQRRGALFWLNLKRDAYSWNSSEPPTGLSGSNDDEERLEETDEERQATKAARQTAQEWLKQN